MAAPGGKFFIQDNIKEVAAHHESWEKLWETKWKWPATMGVYPFMFGAAKDFEPILAKMKEVGLAYSAYKKSAANSIIARLERTLRLEHLP